MDEPQTAKAADQIAQQLARTPEPPYFAVIFTSLRTSGDKGYGAMSDRMVELAARQPGFLGVESARDGEGLGITVSYCAVLTTSQHGGIIPSIFGLNLAASESGTRSTNSGFAR
jgi:hypothetical protein